MHGCGIVSRMLFQSLAAIGCTALLGGGAGAGIGWMIGTHAPDAYRPSVVTDHLVGTDHLESLSPVQFGVGQGLIQGTIGGAR
jgi:hypothetical protein